MFQLLSQIILCVCQIYEPPTIFNCGFYLCTERNLANGICDKGCMTEACFYDGDFLKGFETSDCYLECLSLGCTQADLTNEICDEACNFYQCGWDLGKCGYCRTGCTVELLSNNVCDEECNFQECDFDNLACGLCSSGCFLEDLENLECDWQCNFEDCFYDNRICEIEGRISLKYLKDFDNGVCDFNANSPFVFYDFGDCSCPEYCDGIELGVNDYCQLSGMFEVCKNYQCGFHDGLCGFCAVGCYENMLGNSVCDLECLTPLCGFDKGDCGCAVDCPILLQSESFTFIDPMNVGCKAECLVESCNYASDFCQDREILKVALINTLVFSDFIRKPNLDYCFCDDFEKMVQGTLTCTVDDDCYNEKCLYCAGSFEKLAKNCLRGNEKKCFVCKDMMIKDTCVKIYNECPLGFFENKKLAYIFDDGPVRWCIQDPIKYSPLHYFELIVNSSQKYEDNSFGLGTENFPINCLLYAMISATGSYTKLFIRSENNDLTFNSRISSPIVNNLYSPFDFTVSLELLELWIIGDLPQGKRPVVFWKDKISIAPKHRKVFFVNINFNASQFFKECAQDFCEYCRTIFKNQEKIFDDRGQELENDAEIIKTCSDFHDFDVFQMNVDCSFENVTFSHFRFQFSSFIRTTKSLKLVNVDFIRMQAKAKGSILKFENFELSAKNFLFYKKGIVQDLGAGYEDIKAVSTGSFIYSEMIYKIDIEEVKFLFNFIFSSPQSSFKSYLIYVKDFNRTLSIKNCLFESNYLNYILFVDVKLESPSLFYQTIYFYGAVADQVHFTLENLTIIDNYCSEGMIVYLMEKSLHNFYFSNISIQGVVAGKQGIITLTRMKMPNYEEKYGSTKKIIYFGIESEYHISRRSLNFTAILIKNVKSGLSAIEISGVPNQIITDVFISGVQDGTKEDIQRIIRKFKESGRYLSLIENDELPVMNCSSIISVTKNFNNVYSNIFIENSACVLKQNTFGFVYSQGEGNSNFSFFRFLNILSKSSQGTSLSLSKLEKVLISDLVIESTENLLGPVLKIESCLNITVNRLLVSDVKSYYSSVLTFKDVTFLEFSSFYVSNATTFFSDGGCLSILTSNIDNSIFIMNGSLENCKSINRNGGGIYIGGINLESITQFTIKDLNISNSSANDGSMVFISNLITLSFEYPSIISSIIGNANYADQGGALTLVHRSGFLQLEDIKIKESQGTISGIKCLFKDRSQKLELKNILIEKCNSSNSIISIKGSKIFPEVSIEKLSVYWCSGTILDLSFVSLKIFDFQSENNEFGLFADKSSKVSIFDLKFLNMKNYCIKLRKASSIECVNCRFMNNNHSIIISNERSNSSLISSLVSNNYNMKTNTFNFATGFHLFKNVTFTKNKSFNFPYFSLVQVEIFLDYCRFFDNHVFFSQSIIVFSSKSKIFLKNSTLSHDSSQQGFLFNSVLEDYIEIQDSHFMNNLSDSGIININKGTIQINSTQFLNITSSFIQAKNSKVSLIKSNFISSEKCQTSNRLISVEDDSLFIDSSMISDKSLDENFYIYLFRVKKVEILNTALIGSIKSAALHSIDSNQIFLSNSSIFDFNSSEAAVKFVGFSVFSSVFISGTSIMNNSCFDSGAAIYAQNVELVIDNVKIYDNRAAYKGGGVFFVSPKCNVCGFRLNHSRIFNNSCFEEGGGIFWRNVDPFIENSDIAGNLAISGNDFASDPSKISITTLSIFNKLPSESNDNTLNPPPGQILSFQIKIEIQDPYNQTIKTDFSSTLRVSAKPVNLNESSQTSISGSSEFTASAGTFIIQNLTVYAVPGSKVNLEFYTSTIKNDMEMKGNNSDFITIEFRECLVGEETGPNYCRLCPKDKYLIKKSSQCKICPNGATCPGGSVISVDDGFWRSSLESEVVYRCVPSEACKAGNETNELGSCATGYKGAFCQSCDTGYYKSFNSICAKCPSSRYNKLIAFILISLFIFICYFFVRTTLKSAFSAKSLYSIYIKIFLSYIQLIYLTTQFNIIWPNYIDGTIFLQRNAATLTERIFTFDCYISSADSIESYYFKLVLFAVLPAVLAGCSFLFWVGVSFVKESNVYLKRENFASIIILFYLVYPNILSVMFSHFVCKEADILGFFLSDNTLIKCWTSSHLKYSLIIVIPSIVAWCVMTPLAIMILIIKIRKKLMKDHFRIVYGYLVNGYKKSKFYWEFVINYRKLVLISISVFMTYDYQIIQALTMIITLLTSLYFQYTNSPYSEKTLNTMEIKALLVSTLTIYSGIYFMSKVLDNTWMIFVSIIILFGNSYFLVLWIYFMVKALGDYLMEKFEVFRYYFKKGDSYNENFNEEALNKKGLFKDKDNKQIMTLFELKSNTFDESWKFEDMKELYENILHYD